jgi:hypothetical protein
MTDWVKPARAGVLRAALLDAGLAAGLGLAG